MHRDLEPKDFQTNSSAVFNARFQTNLRIIDDGRNRLLEFIENLKRVCVSSGVLSCDSCNADQRLDCIDKTVKIFVKVLEFMHSQFNDEERLINQFLSPQEVAAHRKDHAEISEGIKSWINELGRHSPVQLAEVLKTIIANWTLAHFEEFDLPLSKTVNGEAP